MGGMAGGIEGGCGMGVIVLLLLVSLSMGVTFLILFVRAIRGGQYEDTVTPAMRVLADDDPGSAGKNVVKKKK